MAEHVAWYMDQIYGLWIGDLVFGTDSNRQI
jgi:hypothetical protein